MPDFEALVRRQQDHQSAAPERLSLVTRPVSAAPVGWLAFAGALAGALLGSVGFQWGLSLGWWRF